MFLIRFGVLYKNGHEDNIESKQKELNKDELIQIKDLVGTSFKQGTRGYISIPNGDSINGKVSNYIINLKEVVRVELEVKEVKENET